MGTILIAMPRHEDAVHLSDILSNQGLLLDIEVCAKAADALRISHDRDRGVVICTKSMKDMSYVELAEYLPQSFGMIILTKDMAIETFNERMVKLVMPFKTRELVSTIEMLTQAYVRKVKKKGNVPIKRSAVETRIIDEAKKLLIDRNGMTEPEAFRYIQKSSMDTGRNMVESAQMILLLNE